MYKAHRDSRFEYATDVVRFIEQRQCEVDCIFSHDYSEEFAMCAEISGDLILEEPIEDLDDLGDDGVVCRRQVRHAAHPDQSRLF